MILLLLPTALASGLLYSASDVAALDAIEITGEVTGRIAGVTETFDFPDPGLESRSFAVVLPEDAAVTGLRYREGEGDWVVAGAVEASAVEVEPGPWGDPREQLEGQVFVVSLPELSGEALQIAVDWQRLLVAEAGALSLEIPLAVGDLDDSDPEVELSLSVDDDAVADATLSPEGSVEADDTHIDASWSGTRSQADALTLSWSVPAPALDARVWTYRPAADPFTGVEGDAGYALVVVQPGEDLSDQVQQIFSFVLDSSASMAGEPLEAAVDAGDTWLADLREEDRFNLIPYQSQPLPFRSRAPRATPSAVERGQRWLARQEARGLSDPADALVEALSLSEDTILQRGLFSCGGTAKETDTAPPLHGAEVHSLDGDPGPAAYVVWLTDGGASTGTTDPDLISDQVGSANGFRASLYAVAVGPDADLDLLGRITAENRGEVRQAETVDDVATAVAELEDRTRNPLLVQPVVDVPGALDQAPAELQDVSKGYELLLAFRYEDAGDTTLRLTGIRGAEDLDEGFDLELPELDERLPAVARAWAQLRVNDLDARYASGDTSVYSEIEALVDDYGVASEVVTLAFESADYGEAALAYGEASGCGCSVSRRGRAALGPGLVLLALVVGRRRGVRSPR